VTPEGTITVYKCVKGLDAGARRRGREQSRSIDEDFDWRHWNKVEQSRLYCPGRENIPLRDWEDSLVRFLFM